MNEITRRGFFGTLAGGAFYGTLNSTGVFASEPEPANPPVPDAGSGATLIEALKNRKSSRSFESKEIPEQVLSELLWAGFGVNRTESGKRTAPSAMNAQEIDIYVAKKDGLFLYDAKPNRLVPVLDEDIRAFCGRQDFVDEAPVNLVYVADLSKLRVSDESEKVIYAAADTGFISQNVYLYCAVKGLATVVRGWIDKAALAKKMQLKPYQKIILSQTVGYPK